MSFSAANVDERQGSRARREYSRASRSLPAILKKRGIDPSPALEFLDHLPALVEPVKATSYHSLGKTARSRIRSRDEDLPIWTEDQDLFGVGIATWTTDRIELYFEDA